MPDTADIGAGGWLLQRR